MAQLVERNGAFYLVTFGVSDVSPLEIIHYYKVARRHAATEDGDRLERRGPGVYVTRHPYYGDIHVIIDPQAPPAFTETRPIPKPRKRPGRGKKWVWKWGRWQATWR